MQDDDDLETTDKTMDLSALTLTCLILEREEGFAIIRLNRPAALNALNGAMMDELSLVIPALDADPAIRAIILTGSEKAFAAGADIREMATMTFPQAVAEDFITRNWEAVARCRTPVIAAVAGYALGGGCELAMMCDIILAADTGAVRAAGDYAGHSARCRRHAAPCRAPSARRARWR